MMGSALNGGCCFAVALLASAPAASADVLEITASGQVIVHRPVAIEPVRPPVDGSRLAAARPALSAAGEHAALSPLLLEAVAWAESRFNDRAVSPKGAVGMMQLMPATAADLGVDARDPAQNARGGAQYLRQMVEMFDGDLQLALAAYNAGPQAVKRYNAVPPFPETQAYVAAVLGYMADRATQETAQ